MTKLPTLLLAAGLIGLAGIVGCGGEIRNTAADDLIPGKSTTTSLSNGFYYCGKCESEILSDDGKIHFRISSPKSETCLHKWEETEGSDIDPL